MRSLLTLLAVLVAGYSAYAGGSLCVPTGTPGTPGLSPVTDSLACIEIGNYYDQTIQIVNFGHYTTPPPISLTVTVDSLAIDSVTNVPCGISYAMNPPSGVLKTDSAGCINVTGISYENVGQYKLGLYLTVYTNFGTYSGRADSILGIFETLLGSSLGVNTTYVLRVINPSDPCPAIDTSTTLRASRSCLPPGSFTVDITGDTEICPGDSTDLSTSITGNGTPPYTYVWSPGSSTDSTLTGVGGGTYTVIVTDNNSTMDTATFTVAVTADPVASFTYTTSGDTVMFSFTGTASGGYYDFGDGDTAQTGFPVHVYAAGTDTFTVTGVAFNDCGVMDTATQVVVLNRTGIRNIEIQNIGISAFPNPVSNMLNIETTTADKATFSMYNLYGVLVDRKEAVTGGKQHFDMSSLPAGTYLIEVKTAKGIGVRKVTKN